MASAETIDTLNRVLETLERSFPQYLRWSRPYIPAGRESVMRTIEAIAAGQDALAERVTDYIYEAGGSPDHGQFSTDFTDMHDLGIDFLVEESIDCLKQDVADLERGVDTLRLEPAAQALASEALGLTKGHIELLEKLHVAPGSDTKVTATPAFANDAPAEK